MAEDEPIYLTILNHLRELGCTDEQLDTGVKVLVPHKDGGDPLEMTVYRYAIDRAEGCCTNCQGKGTDISAPETNGKCWDCYGTGHLHA